jgi:phage shock protein A
MSIFDNVFSPVTSSGNPLHQSVQNARASLGQAINHLLDALGHINTELQQAQQEVAIHSDALAKAQARVNEFQQAALHLATVGQGVENLLAAGQQAQQNPAEAVANIPQDIREVQSVITNAEAVVADTQAAVSPGGEPATHV